MATPNVLNVASSCSNDKKPPSGRRGQPRRLSKLQREIIAFYSRGMDGFVPSRNLERWEYPAGTRDPFARETFYLGGWWSPQSFFRSRKNLIEKGYLEPYTVNAGQYDEHRGHRLTDKAVRKFLSGDRSRVIQPGLAVPLLAGESARPVPEGEEFDDLREIVNQARGC